MVTLDITLKSIYKFLKKYIYEVTPFNYLPGTIHRLF